MFPSLLMQPTAILSIVLCTAVLHSQAGIQQHALRRGRSLDRLSNLPFGPSAPLKPRVALPPYFVTPEWLVDQHDFTSILPIRIAAVVLQDFYENLAGYAATTLAPAACDYQLWFGHVMLEIRAQPLTVVDWFLVQQFALDMLERTKRGYISTYQINFIHRPTGNMMTFNLYIGLLRGLRGRGL